MPDCRIALNCSAVVCPLQLGNFCIERGKNVERIYAVSARMLNICGRCKWLRVPFPCAVENKIVLIRFSIYEYE